ncbi:MAG: DUF1684 domain-containing protein [Chloroflexota bacterium]
MSALTQMRRLKDQSFATDPYSPIPAKDRASFTGLAYFPENEDLSFIVEIEETTVHTEITFQTSTGDVVIYNQFGQVQFSVEGQTQYLTVYQSPEHFELFLPFADATTGTETYGGGRYVDVQPLGSNQYEIDFNQAYNPFCAYSDQWSCPLPPPENRLKVRIEAGEKAYQASSA